MYFFYPQLHDLNYLCIKGNLIFVALSSCPYSCWRYVSFFPLPYHKKNEFEGLSCKTYPREANWPGYASIRASCFASDLGSVLGSSLWSDLGSILWSILGSCLRGSCCFTSCLGRATCCCCWGHLNVNYVIHDNSCTFFIFVKTKIMVCLINPLKDQSHHHHWSSMQWRVFHHCQRLWNCILHELFLFAKIIYSSRSKTWLNKKLTVLTDGCWAGPGFAQGLAELLKKVIWRSFSMKNCSGSFDDNLCQCFDSWFHSPQWFEGSLWQKLELPDENITSREHLSIWEGSKPVCRLGAVVGVDETGALGSQAVCAGGGGSSLAHKVCKGEFMNHSKHYFSLLENAHASINLHSVQKAKHILKTLL